MKTTLKPKTEKMEGSEGKTISCFQVFNTTNDLVNRCLTFKSPAKLILIVALAFFFASAAAPQHKSPWKVPESAKEKKNPFAADESSITRGKESYRTECMRCHGKNGLGDGTSSAKLTETVADLSSPEVQSQTDGVLLWKISEGRRPMPTAKASLTDDQRWDIINYIRTFAKK